MIPFVDRQDVFPFLGAVSGSVSVKLWDENTGLVSRIRCVPDGQGTGWVLTREHPEYATDDCPLRSESMKAKGEPCAVHLGHNPAPLMQSMFNLIHHHKYHSRNAPNSEVTRLRLDGVVDARSPDNQAHNVENLSGYMVLVMGVEVYQFVNQILEQVFAELENGNGRPSEYPEDSEGEYQ
jgi:hypothetical protein